jgi:hypothetical protein
VKKESEKIGVPAKFRKRTLGAPQVRREGRREGGREGNRTGILVLASRNERRERREKRSWCLFLICFGIFSPFSYSPKTTPPSLPPSLPSPLTWPK